MNLIVFHSFTMGDVDDPELYAAQPLWEWQQTEQGQWVMKHCMEPRFEIVPDAVSWGHRVRVYGEVADQDATFFQLKWGKCASSV